MPTPFRGIALLAVVWLCLAADAPPQDIAISIDNFAFTPAQITVPVGAVVVWTNRDDIPHTVTAADTQHSFRSDALDTDEHFAHRFDHAGAFAYFCSLHAHMQGIVVVK